MARENNFHRFRAVKCHVIRLSPCVNFFFALEISQWWRRWWWRCTGTRHIRRTWLCHTA